MTINRRSLIKAAGVGASQLVMAPFVSRPSAAAQVLKMTLADTKLNPSTAAVERFADDVKKRTDGAVEIQVYGIGQLGSQLNILTSLQTGIVDLCAHTAGYVDTIFPRFQVTDLPFLFPNSQVAETFFDGPIGKELLDEMPAKGVYGLGYGHWGWRIISTVGKVVHKADDMNGIKIRVQPGEIYAATFRALGANPIAIDFTEVYLALSQNTIQAIETPMTSLSSAKHDEVIKVINLTNQVYNPSIILASKRRFDGLEPKHQAAIREAMPGFSADWRVTMKKATDEMTAKYEQQGIKINRDVDFDSMRASTKGVEDQFRSIVGADLMDRVLKQVQRAT
jgi:tripartite ATP-independent transporter DctP family solute receptor